MQKQVQPVMDCFLHTVKQQTINNIHINSFW
jgi:hypothetical protein